MIARKRKKLYSHELMKHIEEECHSLDRDSYTKKDLEDYFRENHFYEITYLEEIKTNLFWRITIFLYLPLFLVFICLMPINYLLSGHFKYDKIGDFMLKWANKLNL